MPTTSLTNGEGKELTKLCNGRLPLHLRSVQQLPLPKLQNRTRFLNRPFQRLHMHVLRLPHPRKLQVKVTVIISGTGIAIAKINEVTRGYALAVAIRISGKLS